MRKVTVSLADKNTTDLSQLVDDLRNAGLVVDEVLPAIGTVTGSIEPEAITALQAVPGILHVKIQRDYHLPSAEPAAPNSGLPNNRTPRPPTFLTTGPPTANLHNHQTSDHQASDRRAS